MAVNNKSQTDNFFNIFLILLGLLSVWYIFKDNDVFIGLLPYWLMIPTAAILILGGVYGLRSDKEFKKQPMILQAPIVFAMITGLAVTVLWFVLFRY
ncbi:MAG TPA: hypothetical protein VLG47_04815 [Candidatus Saccharimonadales bacterium]|nr:hypothetical protein [Candidatus Saccharimonadales bacterium]